MRCQPVSYKAVKLGSCTRAGNTVSAAPGGHARSLFYPGRRPSPRPKVVSWSRTWSQTPPLGTPVRQTLALYSNISPLLVKPKPSSVHQGVNCKCFPCWISFIFFLLFTCTLGATIFLGHDHPRLSSRHARAGKTTARHSFV